MHTLTAGVVSQALVAVGVWFGWLIVKEALFAFNMRLKVLSFSSWLIGPAALYAALKFSGIWDVDGFPTSWPVTRQILLPAFVTSLMVILFQSIRNTVLWMSKGGPMLQKTPLVKDIMAWRFADGYGYREPYIFEPSERRRLYQVMGSVFICLIVGGAELHRFYPDFPLSLAYGAIVGTLGLIVAEFRLPPSDPETEERTREFFKAQRLYKKAANRKYADKLAAHPQRRVPGFWEALELFTVILVVIQSCSRGFAVGPDLGTLTIFFWFFTLVVVSAAFEKFTWWLHGTRFYTHGLIGRFYRWQEPSAPAQPFGGSPPATGEELSGLR